MEIFSYIITVTASQSGVELFLAIRNFTGTGRVQYARSNEFGTVELWIVPKSKKSREELLNQLKSIPAIQQVCVVTLTKPITETVLLEVRELFNSVSWDTSDVRDEELASYLDAKLQGKYTFMIDFVRDASRSVEKMRILRADEHPHFSPEWLTEDKPEEDILDKELTIDDIEIRSVVIGSIVEAPTPPPPPPAKSD